MTIKNAIEKFYKWKHIEVKPKTIKGYDMMLRQFCLWVKNCEIENVTFDNILEWFSLMGELGWDRNSFIPKAVAIRELFEFCEHLGLKVIDPWLIPIPSKEYKLPRIAEEGDYRKLLEAIPRKTNDPRHIRNLALISLLYDTGARNGEILSLDIDDLDLVRQRAVIKTEKAKTRRPIREIFWTENTNQYLKNWITKREHLKGIFTLKDKDALFISVTSKQAGMRFSIKGVGEMLRRYCNKAKLPYMNAHSFRHKFGHDLANKGHNNSIISNLLGHSSLQSSFIYTMMMDKELEKKYREVKGQ